MNGKLSLIIRRVLFRIDERLHLIAVGALVGIGSGLASVALNMGLEKGFAALEPYRDHWYGIALPAAGAACSVFFLAFVVRERAGHGVPEVIYSITRHGGLLRFRSSFSRLVSSILTIASGGSAGPEAPIIISGASIGSNIASFFRFRDRQRIVIVGCGAASAIAAIFNAPATGIVFSLEAVLGEWTSINLVPIAISSVVGTQVSRILQGNQIPFEHRALRIGGWDLTACLGLALFTAALSVFLVRLLREVGSRSGKWVPSFWLRAALGGLGVGLLGAFWPDVLGEGYHTVASVIGERYAPEMLLVGIVLLAKILATALTLGTGGSGGVFAPCLVVGSFAGLFYQQILRFFFPSVPWAGEGYFALLGMAGIISSVLQAPMTGIFLILEITGGYEVIVSVVTVAVLSATISHYFEPFSVYYQELIERGELLRPRTDARVLSELSVMELLDRRCTPVYPEMRLKELIPVIQHSHQCCFPVEDSVSGDFLGVVHLNDVRAYLFDPTLRESLVVEEVMDPRVPTVSPEDELSDVLDLYERSHREVLPVVREKKLLGFISKTAVLDHYRKELLVQEEIP